jgi:hypothetical protein
MHRDYLSRGNIGSTSSTPRAVATSSSGRITSTIHRRGSIADRHGFINSLPRQQQLSHLFK